MAYVISQKAARALTRLVRGSFGATAPTYSPAAISPDVFPPPFTVRWSQSEKSGQGAWVIWLPLNTGGNHVYIGRERRSIAGNINAAQALPAGWYTLDMLPANYSGSLWLNASKAKEAGQTESTFFATTGQGDGSGNMYWYAAIVARIDYDSETGGRRVKQLIDSTVTFGANIGDGGGGGGGVELDGISTNGNAQNQVQVHNWNTGTPESGTTLAQDLHDADGVTAQGTLVERTTGGALNYKKIGTLAQLLGSTVSLSSQKILTGLTWNTSTHELVISSANITIANGVITSWTNNADEAIDSTPISDIIQS